MEQKKNIYWIPAVMVTVKKQCLPAAAWWLYASAAVWTQQWGQLSKVFTHPVSCWLAFCRQAVLLFYPFLMSDPDSADKRACGMGLSKMSAGVEFRLQYSKLWLYFLCSLDSLITVDSATWTLTPGCLACLSFTLHMFFYPISL